MTIFASTPPKNRSAERPLRAPRAERPSREDVGYARSTHPRIQCPRHSVSIIEVPPRFRVAVGEGRRGRTVPDERHDRCSRRALAFGDSTHETTRMCLQALAAFAPRRPFRLLDVGSGTGILSIGAVKLGGSAIGVEIDGEAANVAAVRTRGSTAWR